MQNIGNKLIKKNSAGQITELYRITSRSEKDYYKVSPIIGSRTLIRKDDLDGLTSITPHCKLFIELCTLKDGSKDLCFSIYNEFEGFNFPYFASRLNYRITDYKSGKSICKYQYATGGLYQSAYDILMSNIVEKTKAYTIDLYLNDSLKNIISLIKLQPWVCDAIREISESYNANLNDIYQGIEIALKNIEFMYWFHYNFKVFKVLFEVKAGQRNLRPGDLFVLEAIAETKIVDYNILEYYHDIELSKIRGNFFFIQDKNDRTFIVKYVSIDDLPGLHLN